MEIETTNGLATLYAAVNKDLVLKSEINSDTKPYRSKIVYLGINASPEDYIEIDELTEEGHGI